VAGGGRRPEGVAGAIARIIAAKKPRSSPAGPRALQKARSLI